MVGPFLPPITAAGVTKLWDYTGKPLFGFFGRHLLYVFHYKKNMDNFNRQLRDLNEQKQTLKAKVDEAKRNGGKIDQGVEDWFSRVDSLIASEKVTKLRVNEGEEALAKKWTCGGLFSNLAFRYRMGKGAKKAEKDILVELEHRFDSVSHGTSLPYEIVNQGYEGFESRLIVLEEIMGAMRDGNVRMVGMYGMGGVGKTMLAKEVARRGKEENLFSEVILLTVSQNPDYERIQREICDLLGLQVADRTQPGRACLVSQELSRKKNILIILDDVWKKLDLIGLGVDFTEDQCGCKILVTTRYQDLKNRMPMDKNFVVKCLFEDEAKELFCKFVGDLDKDPSFEPWVVKVVKECGGLPVAITTIASALKGKELTVWKNALDELRQSAPENIEGVSKEVYSSIRLSFNFLESEEAKSLLLLCSMYEEDAKIRLEDLMAQCLGWGIFEGANKIEQSRSKVHTVVDKLRAHCLLGGDSKYYVVMHDVIRDVAISIGSKERHMFNFTSVDEFSDSLEEEKLKDSTAISLPANGISNFPERLPFSKLLFFKLQSYRSCYPKLSDSFFHDAESLRVLDLPTVHLSSPPPYSFSSLSNLQTLCLKSCIIESTSFIGCLKKLKILDLSRSTISCLSEELGQLSRLQLLNLEGCKKLKSIEPKAISGLKNLEELYMGNVLIGWETEVRNSILVELDKLSKLNTLQMGIEDRNIPELKMFAESLTRYQIYVGMRPGFSYPTDVSKMLFIEGYQNSVFDVSLKQLVRRSTLLHFDQAERLENIITEPHEDGFPQLKYFDFRGNNSIPCIVDWTKHARSAFQNLEVLCLSELKNLVTLCHGEPIQDSFGKLKEVTVTRCERLKNFFSSYPASVVEQIEEITVKRCEAIEEIVLLKGRSEVLNKYEFKKLQYLTVDNSPKFVQLISFESEKNIRDSVLSEDRRLVLFDDKVSLPCLKKLTVSDCAILNSLLSLSTAESLLQLESLIITNCKAIKELVLMTYESQSSSQAEVQIQLSVLFPKLKNLQLSRLERFTSIYDTGLSNNLQPLIVFGNLQQLIVTECPSLPHLLTYSAVKSLEQLKTLGVGLCESMEFVVANATVDQQVSSVSFPKLENLWLSYLPNLKMFCERDGIEFPSLRILDIRRCETLMTFIANVEPTTAPNSRHFAGSTTFPDPFDIILFQNVESIHLEGIPVENVSQHRESETENKNSITPTRVRELRLKRLPKLENFLEAPGVRSQPCMCLVSSSVSLPLLSVLEVSGCERLKSLFSHSTAKSLVQLKTMMIWNCVGMTEVVVASEGDESAMIVFSRLETLALQALPSLERFHGGRGDIVLHFPVLETVVLSECPEMNIFSAGVTNSPSLKGVTMNVGSEDLLSLVRSRRIEDWIEGSDLNAITSKIYETNSKKKGKRKVYEELNEAVHRGQSTYAENIASSSK